MRASLTYFSQPSWSGNKRSTARRHLGALPGSVVAASGEGWPTPLEPSLVAEDETSSQLRASAAGRSSLMAGGGSCMAPNSTPGCSSWKLPTCITSEPAQRASSNSPPGKDARTGLFTRDSTPESAARAGLLSRDCGTSAGTVEFSGDIAEASLTEAVLRTMNSSSESPPPQRPAPGALGLPEDGASTGEGGRLPAAVASAPASARTSSSYRMPSAST
mmetsp:Transcript_79237/g.250320  ORF Transcript_79237/g.250320 Transcript_79237/m.250320 type:complete len:218 (-) Transcript_79237:118-771(-)